MADYYTQFSAIFVLETDEQRAWVMEYLPLAAHYYEEVGIEELLEKLGEELPGEHWQRFKAMLLGEEPTPIDGELTKGHLTSGNLWIYSEENGSVELAAAFIQLLMERFDMDTEFIFSWAETCSRMRADGFCGGTALVTKDGWALCTANDQLEVCREQLAKING